MVSGDIGCYTLAFADPYNAMDQSICMGASISVGHGAQKIFDSSDDNKMKVVSVLGDSTFFHTGINSLINASYNKSNAVTVILDNRITGMTGHQENPGSGYTLQGEKTNELDIKAIVRALGIKNLVEINPNDLTAVKNALDWALELEEPSVIITRWPCALKKFSPEGKVIVNNLEIGSMPVLSGKADYPKNAVEILEDKVETIVVNASGEAEKLGNPKVMNVISLGVIIKAMGLEEIDWEKILKDNIKENLIDLNLKAIEIGMSLV